MPPPPLPTHRPAVDRLLGVDVLRGVAILGILVINIQSFAMPAVAYVNPYVFGDFSGANALVWRLGHVFASGKFIATFSILFGAGIALRDRHAGVGVGAGVGAAAVHVRRMAVLVALGLVHAYGLWYGDILVSYGLIGLLVFTLRGRSARTLLALAAAAYAAGLVLNLGLAATLHHAPPDARDAVLATFAPDAAELAREVAAYRGSWPEQMPWRSAWAFEGHTFALLVWSLPYLGGLMLLGMTLAKLGFLDGGWPARRYATVAAVGCALGWSLATLQLVLDARTGHDPLLMVLVWPQVNVLAMPLVSVGYAAAVQWVVARRPAAPALRPLAAVGRTALSCYLLSTVLCTTLFYGHGFGWFGSVDRVGQLGVVAGVWAILLVVAPLWLARFRFGPVEWLWRSAAYGRWQAGRNAE